MNMKKLLKGSLALAAIGGASFVGLHYQLPTIERKERKRKADKFYTEQFCGDTYQHFKYGSEWQFVKIKKDMREDGYTHAEIGIIQDKGFTKGFDRYSQEFDKEMADLERLEKLDEDSAA